MVSKKQIVFFCGSHPFIMIYKVAKLFKEKGYETILVSICEEERMDYDFYKEVFDKIIYPDFRFSKSNLKNPFYTLKRISKLSRFIFAIKKLNPYVVIGIAGNNWPLRLGHKYFFKKYPFIYFPYDVLSHFFESKEEAIFKGTPLFEINAERYCFENSDGIIHKGSPEELVVCEGRLHKKINFVKNQINFLPYYSKEFAVPYNKNKLSKKEKRFHIVYTGFLSNDPKFVERIMYLFNEMIKQKIHVHVYGFMSHLSKDEEEKYMNKLFKDIIQEDYFHLHKPMGSKEIVFEISKYDFGFWPAWVANDNSIEPLHATGNKVASYLESGLSFIYDDKCTFIDKIMTSLGLKFPINQKTVKTLSRKLKQVNPKTLESDVKKAIKKFDMKTHFPRLEKFLEVVVENSKTKN